jgi:NAD(P)-dependent dehydrogenase (short-subunit alcohol dehydrogenase family)
VSDHGYVISGGSEATVSALAGLLRAPILHGLVDEAAGIAGSIAAWVHLIEAGDGGELEALLAAAELAEQHLPDGEGATFVVVAPVWGVVEPPAGDRVEFAAAAARALLQTRVEPWAARGRRINAIAHGPIQPAVAGARDDATLTARSPMHRLGSLRELADGIDFLASVAAAYVTGAVLTIDGGWTAYSWFYPARDL